MNEKLEIDLLVGDQRRSSGTEVAKVSADRLKENLEEFTRALSHSFGALSRGVDGAKLEELSVQVTVGAEGSIKLLGTGGSASAEGSITLTYRFAADAT